MDFMAVTAGMTAFKAGVETLRAAIGIVKDVRDALPSSGDKDRIGDALDEAMQKMAEGEATVASALGYTLCRCAFPPTPMLTVGHIPIRSLNGIDKGQALSRHSNTGGGMTGSIPVHECPKCKTTDAPTYPNFERTVVASG